MLFQTLCRFQKSFFFSAIFAEFLQRQSLNEEEFLEIKEPYLYPGFREVAVDDYDDYDDHDDSVDHDDYDDYDDYDDSVLHLL